MEQDFFLLDLPIFQPKYENKVYGHSNESRKRNTLALLTKESRGYCMYCFNRVDVNGNNYGHIEHALEVNNTKVLEDCVPNLGLACNKCNQSYKNRGEEERRLTKKQVESLEQCECSAQKCKEMCSTYSNKNVIDEKSILAGITVNHLVVELFREKLASVPLDTALKICETV